MELKYLLNSFAITLLSVIFLLSIINEGLILFLHLPLSSFIICHVFLRSCLFSMIWLKLNGFNMVVPVIVASLCDHCIVCDSVANFFDSKLL